MARCLDEELFIAAGFLVVAVLVLTPWMLCVCVCVYQQKERDGVDGV